MQKHWDVMRTDDAGESWREVSGNLPTDFGFAIDVHAHEPETIYVVPIKSDLGAFSAGWTAARVPQPDGWRGVGAAHDRAAAGQLLCECACGMRWRLTRWSRAGVYFGTTGGQVYASADAGDTWQAIVRDLPAVLSVEVQTLR